MGQTNAIRVLNDVRVTIQNPASSTRQEVLKTGCFRCGDELEFYDSPDGLCLPATSMGKRSIDCIDPDSAYFLATTIDLSGASGTVIAVNRTLETQQDMNDRLCDEGNPHNTPWIQSHAIQSSVQDSPIIGQMTLQMIDGTQCYAAGDAIKILADSGVVVSANIVSVNNSQKEVVIDNSVDLSAETNVKLSNCCNVSLEEIIQRFKDASTGGTDCEDDYDGDCKSTAFETTSEMLPLKSHPSIDGRLMRRGLEGVRSTLSDGAVNTEITFTALTLGVQGDNFSVEIINAAGLAVTVSGNYPNCKISVDNNSGAATVADIKAAIEADPIARRMLQIGFGGGDGTGLAAALVETNLAGGTAPAGMYDYAEVNDENGDLKWLVFHISGTRNGLKKPFAESEWLHVDYKC